MVFHIFNFLMENTRDTSPKLQYRAHHFFLNMLFLGKRFAERGQFFRTRRLFAVFIL